MYYDFLEADVHTATPSLSNAAATWAGWAVSAVTAKFYRSQSDTVRSSSGGNYSTTHGKSLSKTSASLGILNIHLESYFEKFLQ